MMPYVPDRTAEKLFFFLQEWYICPIETHLDNEEEKDFQNQAGGIFNAWQKFI